MQSSYVHAISAAICWNWQKECPRKTPTSHQLPRNLHVRSQHTTLCLYAGDNPSCNIPSSSKETVNPEWHISLLSLCTSVFLCSLFVRSKKRNSHATQHCTVCDVFMNARIEWKYRILLQQATYDIWTYVTKTSRILRL